jgi:Lon protease-like protein
MIEGYQRLDPYRIARLRPLQDDAGWAAAAGAAKESTDLLALFQRTQERAAAALQIAASLAPDLGPEAILNSIAMHLDVEPQVKQVLLEIDSVGARYRSVLKILGEALSTQDRIDKARHRIPEDPTRN